MYIHVYYIHAYKFWDVCKFYCFCGQIFHEIQLQNFTGIIWFSLIGERDTHETNSQ